MLTLRVRLNSLSIEKEILTKTISRLYQHEMGLSKIQRDRLLIRYQHQLGIVLAKIEKIRGCKQASRFGSIRRWLNYINGSKAYHS